VKQLVFTSLLLLLISSAGPAHAQRDQRDPRDTRPSGDRGVPSYNNDTQQLGYEHGYRDGADRGRQDRDRGAGRSLQPNDYRQSARYSYNASYGNQRDYMAGYQQGFQTGYDDGFNYYERDGRYGQIYGRNRSPEGSRSSDSSRSDGPRSSARPDGSRFSGPPDGARSSGSRNIGSRFDEGYRDGVASGQDDQRRNTRSDYRSSSSYRGGDTNYQDGFERGYQDGYGRSRYQTDGGGYFPNRGNSGPADTRDGVGPQTRTFVVPSTNQWTPTGIRVNQGDHVRFESTGEIQLRPASFNDKANVAGSLTGRKAPNSPIPTALAGALIGRIDSGQPWGLGNLTDVVMPASGLLYLGINDDVLTDNSGQFTVKISW
jgi:hypothetical protein